MTHGSAWVSHSWAERGGEGISLRQQSSGFEKQEVSKPKLLEWKLTIFKKREKKGREEMNFIEVPVPGSFHIMCRLIRRNSFTDRSLNVRNQDAPSYACEIKVFFVPDAKF